VCLLSDSLLLLVSGTETCHAKAICLPYHGDTTSDVRHPLCVGSLHSGNSKVDPRMSDKRNFPARLCESAAK
jgi:hypothetical protein